ncbi:MAG: imidazoleglycerol-phosphate dehydratase HisB [Candidatus Omnitrophica bacterium]|nr:imidazoleglycerol-phosphate dehydratase HisB [Candidatus Omnitrophota bacterium]
MKRKTKVYRKTKETEISVALNLDGSGGSDIEIPIGFLAHLVTAFTQHSLMDLKVRAKGDLEVDQHHLTEDLGLVLGQALAKALSDKKGIRRFGFAAVPMDEALVETTVDISGRPYLFLELPRLPRDKGHFEFGDAREFLNAFVKTSGITLHIETRRGQNQHHILEALFKSLGRALKEAVSLEPRLKGKIPSTKGEL